jgi:hypothetical protein
MMARVLLFLVAALTAGGLYVYFNQEPSPSACSSCGDGPRETAITVAQPVFSESDRFRQEILSSLSFLPGAGYPAALPWVPVHQIGVRDCIPLENLLSNQPLAFLEMCLERYEREVRGYKLTMLKRERIRGRLYPPNGYEKVHAHFREQPFSVLMNWQENARHAQKVLYVQGENNGKMLVRPTGFILGNLVVSREVDGAEAKDAGHYTPNQFGLYLAMKRSVDSMRAAQARGALHVTYEGLVTVTEIGDRTCYKFVRTPYEPPEEQGVNDLTLYVDTETWLQVGSSLRDSNGELIGEYFFRDIELNPTFSGHQFQRGAI